MKVPEVVDNSVRPFQYSSSSMTFVVWSVPPATACARPVAAWTVANHLPTVHGGVESSRAACLVRRSDEKG